MTDSARVHERVRRDYAALVTQPAAIDDGQPFLKGTAVRVAGYQGSELAGLPDESISNAFGCGNPVAFSEMNEGDVVLDLGSGAGIDLLLAARKVGSTGRVIGVDMTDEMIVKARAAVAAAGLQNVEVRKGYIESLPVSDESVDWVVSNCVINLSPEKHRVFGEIARVLRPDGRMLVSDIVVEGLSDELRAALGPVSCCLASAISEGAYQAGLSAAGLGSVEVRDRFEYDEAVLREMACAETKLRAKGVRGGGDVEAVDREALDCLAKELVGKVRAIYVYARKPAYPPKTGTIG